MPCLHDEGYAAAGRGEPGPAGGGAAPGTCPAPEQRAGGGARVAPRRVATSPGPASRSRAAYDAEGVRRPARAPTARSSSSPVAVRRARAGTCSSRPTPRRSPAAPTSTSSRWASGPSCRRPDSRVGSTTSGSSTTRRRPHAFAAAAAYVQPSRNESFSRTVMEAWLAGTLVLANGESAVVRWHCERSGAGVVWDGLDELTAALEAVAAAPAASPRWPRRGGATCSSTTPGRRCSTGWKRRWRIVRWVIVGRTHPSGGRAPRPPPPPPPSVSRQATRC